MTSSGIAVLEGSDKIMTIQINMEKQYRMAYFNLTRHNPLPHNCLPLSPKQTQRDSLKKLLEINQTIMDMLEPPLSPHKGHLLSIDSDRNTKRIHPNVSYLATTINPNTERLKAQRKQKLLDDAQPPKESVSVRRKDIYDDHIDKYMTNKLDSKDIIEKYLTNRQQFVREACKNIEQEIRADVVQPKRSLQRRKSREEVRKLPKLQQFSSYMLRKDKRRSEDGPYLKSINQLKKAELLQHKERERKQRVFRKKIHSLQIRLDKIRENEL